MIFALLAGVCSGHSSTISDVPIHNLPQEQLFFNPFRIQIDPMERLLLVNLENDPDSLYIGFEPQVFNDSINGTGMLVIAWRADGYVDVYHQPGLNPDPGKYDIAGKGLKNKVCSPLHKAFFRVEEQGVQAWFSLEDIWGRTIEVGISESNSTKRKPFGLLAPMGQAATQPSAMPVVLLHDFYFVRQKNTEIIVRIDGTEHKPDKLPIPLDRRRMYFARYSPDPLIATLNPAFSGILQPLAVTDPIVAGIDNTLCIMESNHGIWGLKKMEIAHAQHNLTLAFEPAFPDIMLLADQQELTGKFTLAGHRSTGRIAGTYLIRKDGHKVGIQLHPGKGWKPRAAGKASLRFLYTVAGVFRNWPKSYLWTAEVDLSDPSQAFMQSGWERIAP